MITFFLRAFGKEKPFSSFLYISIKTQFSVQLNRSGLMRTAGISIFKVTQDHQYGFGKCHIYFLCFSDVS